MNELRVSARRRVRRDPKTVKRHGKPRVKRELLEQCGQVATLVECFAWRNDAMSASSSSKNFIVPSIRASPLNTENPRRESRNSSQMERRLHISASTRVASTRVATLVWREIDAFESHIDKCGDKL